MAYVLVVDDDEDFANAAALELRDAGHEVRIEVSPSRGLAAARERKPDLIVLDVMFPEDISAGFELARRLHDPAGRLSDVPVLMLTAVNQRFPLGFGAEEIDGEWLPVAGFVEKPVDLDVLRTKVAEVLERSERQADGPG